MTEVVLDSDGLSHPNIKSWRVLRDKQYSGIEVNKTGIYLTFDGDGGSAVKFGPVDLSCKVLDFNPGEYQ